MRRGRGDPVVRTGPRQEPKAAPEENCAYHGGSLRPERGHLSRRVSADMAGLVQERGGEATPAGAASPMPRGAAGASAPCRRGRHVSPPRFQGKGSSEPWQPLCGCR